MLANCRRVPITLRIVRSWRILAFAMRQSQKWERVIYRCPADCGDFFMTPTMALTVIIAQYDEPPRPPWGRLEFLADKMN